MARKKQREAYGSGSVSPELVAKKDKDGNPIVDPDGKPVKVQLKNKAGKPVWRCVISLGSEEYVDENGKLRKRQRKVQKRFAGTLQEARSEVEALAKTYQQVDISHAKDNFSKLVDDWSSSGELACSERQKAQYLRLLGYVATYLDDRPVVSLKRHDVEDAFIKAMVRPNGKALSSSTQKKARTVVHRVFEYGVDMEYLEKNPCRMPKRKKYGTGGTLQSKQRTALSTDDAAKLCAYLDETEAQSFANFTEKELRQEAWGNNSNRSLVRNLSTISCILSIRLMLATGVRRGEAFGLTWGNVNLAKGTIRISQTLTEAVEVKEPKTSNGIRNLFVDQYTLEHLRKWKEFQKEALSNIMVDGAPLVQTKSTPVFCSDRGGWIDPTNASRWWRSYRVEAGFDSLLIHELRHSQNTWLFTYHPEEEGLIKTRMGHSRASSISLVYLHEMPARDKHLADTIGRILYESRIGAITLLKTA
jgi:integrase